MGVKGNLSKKTPTLKLIDEHAAGAAARHDASAIDYFGGNVGEALGSLNAALGEHSGDGGNPHNVTKAQIGLGEVNTVFNPKP